MGTKTVWVRGTTGNTVNLIVYAPDGSEEVSSTAMTEISGTGMFYYTFTTTTAGVYAAKIDNATSGRSMGMQIIDMSILDKVADILRVETNKLQIINNQLIIFADDKTTPLYTFDLANKRGSPTMVDVFKRTPV